MRPALAAPGGAGGAAAGVVAGLGGSRGRRRARRSKAGTRSSQPLKLPGLGQLLSLSLTCLIVVSDFQQQIANQCAQSTKKQLEADAGAESSLAALGAVFGRARSGYGNDSRAAAKSDRTTTAATTEAPTAARCARPLLMLAEAIPDANRLYEDLMMTYNRIVRPVQNNSDPVVVKLSLKLSQLIDVNLKNQIMTTNVWLKQEWSDHKLKWEPDEYGGIKDINLPAEQIWLPDIVLYNSAEGFFAVSIMTKAKISYDGNVTWNPPAIFRSSCLMDVTHFPFDSQTCRLKFGSWTYAERIDLRHSGDNEAVIENAIDLSEYYQSVEWDIMRAVSRRNRKKYDCCAEIYTDVTFNITLRRKPLFYTVNLILPCLGITILSFLVFYLPSDSGEKVTLSISILISLIFFLSVLIETIPPSSLVMPLLVKYLVFTLVLITFSVCATVCVLNIHFRTPSTHWMSPWVKRWCIDILPKYLFMNVPQYQNQQAQILPEQLIYLHNQAYQVGGWPLPAARPPQAVVTEPGSVTTQAGAAPKANQTQANHAAAGGLQNNNNNSGQHRQLLQHMSSSSSSFRQPDPNKLDASELLAASGSNNKLSISPSSLFLPYLQSEAARRLQMQRSRSSERDNRSASDNLAQNTTTTSTSISAGALPSSNSNMRAAENGNKNKNCDESQRAGGAGGSTKLEMHQRDSSSSSATRRRKEAATRGGGGARPPSKPAKSSSGGGLWRLFGSSSAAGNKLTDRPETESNDDGRGDEQQAAQRQQSANNNPLNLVCSPHFRLAASGQQQHQHQLQHDTSSSFETDYQHHNHFQARASICSTNLWRIGPTRRCSMTVANNYPTYYRPLAQLAHLPHSHAHSGGGHGAHQLSTVSGCVQSHHYHTHLASLTSSSNEESSPISAGGRKPSAVGALITAAASNLAVRPRQQQQLVVPSGSAAGYATAPSMEARPVGHSQSSNWLSSSGGASQQPRSIAVPMMGSMTLSPTPPPPFPPELAAGQLGEQLGAPSSQMQMLGPALHTVAIQRQQQQQQAFRNMRLQASSASGGFGGGHNNEAGQRTNMASTAAGSLRFPQQPQPYQAAPSAASFGQQPQSMTRSRSTDHRLHSASADCPTAQMGANLPLYQPQQRPGAMRAGFAPPPSLPAGISSIYRQQQQATQGGQLGSSLPLAGSSSGPTNLGAPAAGALGAYHQQLMQQPQSIGRALGQAYMQRLQRQPTIYSLHSNNIQRPSRPAQRGPTTTTHTYLMSLEGSDRRQASRLSVDRMRRSRSQTSLDRRAQLFDADGDCEQCASQANNYLRRADSSARVSKLGHSGGQEGLRFAGDGSNNNSDGCNCDSQQHRRRLHSTGCEMETPMLNGSGYQLQQQQQQKQLRQRHSFNKDSCYVCCNQHQEQTADAGLLANGPSVVGLAGCPGCRGALAANANGGNDFGAAGADQFQAPPLSSLGFMKLIGEVEKAIQNAMFIAQHIDNLDEFESVKENWKYIAMVIDRIFLIIFLIAGIVGTAAIVAMIPWDYYIVEKPIDLPLTRMLALNLTQGQSYPANATCQKS